MEGRYETILMMLGRTQGRFSELLLKSTHQRLYSANLILGSLGF